MSKHGYRSPLVRRVNARKAIGSAAAGRPAGYDRYGPDRLEDARRPITSDHKAAGAGRIM